MLDPLISRISTKYPIKALDIARLIVQHLGTPLLGEALAKETGRSDFPEQISSVGTSICNVIVDKAVLRRVSEWPQLYKENFVTTPFGR